MFVLLTDIWWSVDWYLQKRLLERLQAIVSNTSPTQLINDIIYTLQDNSYLPFNIIDLDKSFSISKKILIDGVIY